MAFEVRDTTILARKLFVLEVKASALARLCGRNDDTVNKRPVHLRHLLRCVYGGEAPETCVISRIGKDLVVSAYRFGVTGLKLEVGRTMVERCMVNVSNCIDTILYSEKHNCLLLKNHAISFFVLRSRDVLVCSESFDALKWHS